MIRQVRIHLSGRFRLTRTPCGTTAYRTPTDYRYTSQREDASIGLYLYRETSLWDNAPALGGGTKQAIPPPRVVKFIEIPYAHLTRVRFSVENF